MGGLLLSIEMLGAEYCENLLCMKWNKVVFCLLGFYFLLQCLMGLFIAEEWRKKTFQNCDRKLLTPLRVYENLINDWEQHSKFIYLFIHTSRYVLEAMLYDGVHYIS